VIYMSNDCKVSNVINFRHDYDLIFAPVFDSTVEIIS
jgi:hypothetical protein